MLATRISAARHFLPFWCPVFSFSCALIEHIKVTYLRRRIRTVLHALADRLDFRVRAWNICPWTLPALSVVACLAFSHILHGKIIRSVLQRLMKA